VFFATIDLTNPSGGDPLGVPGCCGFLGRIDGGFRLPVSEVDEPVAEVPVIDGGRCREPLAELLGVDPDADLQDLAVVGVSPSVS